MQPSAGSRYEVGAIATTAALAGGELLTQTVIVPQWRAMDPAEFLRYFASYGPVLGATLFPIEIVSVALLIIIAYSNIKRRSPGRLAWSLAAACMVGTVLLLPMYFAGADFAMIDPAFPPHAVPAELSAWYRWNWVRAGLTVIATSLSCVTSANAHSSKTAVRWSG